MPDGCGALLDVNVILDVLQRRQPFYDDSAAVLAAARQDGADYLVTRERRRSCLRCCPATSLPARGPDPDLT